MRRIVGIIILAVLIFIGIVIFLVYPREGFGREAFVDIPHGTGSRAIARLLADAGVIPSRWAFLAVRALRPGATLKAGEYRFDRPASTWEVFDRIARGDVYVISLVVPEGENIFEIAERLEKSGVMQRDDFLKAARDTSVIRDLDPHAPSLEGFLFPDTYRFHRKSSPLQLAKMMTGRFRKAWQELGAPGADVHTVVTLASLVETEARVPAERPVIASVYSNRLRAGMPLQADPTAVYAALLEDRYRGTIYASDLSRTNPYNTYRNAGLPPGPIANPGLQSLEAALHPAGTEYLYFVAKADGSGEHRFSTGLAQHALAVQKYRRAVAEERNGKAGASASAAGSGEAAADRPRRGGRAGRAARTR